MQRKTKQRQLIQEIIFQAKRPLGPDEIWQQAQQSLPRLGIATVYRTIKGLREEELIHAVKIPGQADRYERADLHHHHHFVCNQCDKVYEMEAESCQHLHHEVPKGFTVKRHEVILYGNCENCA